MSVPGPSLLNLSCACFNINVVPSVDILKRLSNLTEIRNDFIYKWIEDFPRPRSLQIYGNITRGQVGTVLGW